MTATSRSFKVERKRPLEFDPHPEARKLPDPRNLERSKTPPYVPRGLDHKTIVELYALQGGLCVHCLKAMLPTAARKKRSALGAGPYDKGWTREHVVPASHGGKNGRNIVLAHRGCNSGKGDRMPTDRELFIANQLHNGVPLKRFVGDYAA